MPVQKLALLTALSCLMLSSCVTRVFCSADDPKLPRRRAAVPHDKSETGRLSLYVVGQQAKDGFVVESVTRIQVMPQCGLGLMAPVFTLGLLPANLPYQARVTVTGHLGGKQQTRTYHAGLHSLTCVWVAVVPPCFDDRALARAFLKSMASNVPMGRDHTYW